jgi:glycosyltransferase involved in cell wall biosynthesis
MCPAELTVQRRSGSIACDSPACVLLAGDFPERPPLTIGGIQAVTWQLASGLASLGEFEVHTAASERFWHSPPRRSWRRQWGACTAHYRCSPKRLPHVACAWTTDAEYIRWQIRATGARLVHAHGQVGYAIGAIRSGIPHVVTPHGMLRREKRAGADAPTLSRERLREALWVGTENWCLAHAEHVVAISPYVRQLIAPRTRGRLHEIPNPVDAGFYSLARPAGPREPILLTVGWLNTRKRQELIIRALPRIRERAPGARLRIVGNVEAAERAHLSALRRLVGELGVGDAVEILQHVSHEQMLEEYRRAAVYVHAAEEESSPMAVAQAMAAGLPLCAVDIPGLHHLLREGSTGLYAREPTAESIARAVTSLLEDPDLARSMGERAASEAWDRFHPGAVAAATADLYHEILQGRWPPPGRGRPAAETWPRPGRGRPPAGTWPPSGRRPTTGSRLARDDRLRSDSDSRVGR